MKKIVLFVTLLFATTMAQAVTSQDVKGVGFDNLSEQDKLTIMKEIADKAPSAAPTVLATVADNVTNPDKVSKWVQLGADIGKGLASAAKELGVAANDFVNTPVGKWVAFLIIWHFIGSMAVHVGAGIFLVIMSVVCIWFYARKSQTVRITYDKDKTDWFGRSVLVSVNRESLSTEDKAVIMTAAFVTLVVWVIITFTW